MQKFLKFNRYFSTNKINPLQIIKGIEVNHVSIFRNCGWKPLEVKKNVDLEYKNQLLAISGFLNCHKNIFDNISICSINNRYATTMRLNKLEIVDKIVFDAWNHPSSDNIQSNISFNDLIQPNNIINIDFTKLANKVLSNNDNILEGSLLNDQIRFQIMFDTDRNIIKQLRIINVDDIIIVDDIKLF